MVKVSLSELLFQISTCITTLKCWHSFFQAIVTTITNFLFFQWTRCRRGTTVYWRASFLSDWGAYCFKPYTVIPKLASYQIPVIAIEREAEYISSITTDNYMGSLQATSLLIRDKCDILIHINVNVEKQSRLMIVYVHLRKHVKNIRFLMTLI